MNALTAPWIPVTLMSGGRDTVSVLDAFRDAHLIRAVEADSPMTTRAIERLLIGITLAAGISRRTGLDVAQVEGILEEHRAGFEQDRVCQYDISGPTAARQDLGRLIFEDSNCLHLPGSISPSEAMAAALTRMCFDPAGIRTGMTGDPYSVRGKSMPIGPAWLAWCPTVLVHPRGGTLSDMIMWNLPDHLGGELPMWADDPARPRETYAADDISVSRLMTWPARRLRIRWEDGDAVGALLGNGDIIEKVDPLVTVEPHGLWYHSKQTKRVTPRQRPEMRRSRLGPLLAMGGPLPLGVRRLQAKPIPASIHMVAVDQSSGILRNVEYQQINFDLDALPVEAIEAFETAIQWTENLPGTSRDAVRSELETLVLKWIGGHGFDEDLLWIRVRGYTDDTQLWVQRNLGASEDVTIQCRTVIARWNEAIDQIRV